ncbi:MAG: response regulator [Gammaproteobacteria bacterium]|nr:response regulator [Gammaproteobacteria bacterium]
MNQDPTVFIVDDDKNILFALRFLLEAEDLNVEIYSSAQAFLNNYDGNQLGCLLLDLRMPGMNGLELQELLSARGIVIPIIIITGQGDRLMTIRALKAGAIDVLEKPFDDHKLLQHIHNALAGDSEYAHSV